MPLYFIYPIYTGALALVLISVVPKKHIRRLAMAAITFGAVGSLIAFGVYGLIFNALEWLNYGPFGHGDIPFFPPLAWTVYFIMYFYFLPEKAPWKHMFVLFSAANSTLFSNVLMNLGIFQWNRGRVILPFLIYLSWFAIVTWAYERTSSSNPIR